MGKGHVSMSKDSYSMLNTNTMRQARDAERGRAGGVRRPGLSGATRIKRAVFCAQGISLQSTVQDVVKYFEDNKVTVTNCTLFQSQKGFGTCCARLQSMLTVQARSLPPTFDLAKSPSGNGFFKPSTAEKSQGDQLTDQ